MNKIALLCAGFAGLIGLAACSSDQSLTITTSNAADSPGNPDVTLPAGVSLPPGVTLPDISDLTLPPGISLPPGVTLPDISNLTIPGLPDVSISSIPGGTISAADCQKFVQIFGSVFTGQDVGIDDFPAALESLAKSVPAELQDDYATASEGLIPLQALYAKYNYDYSKILTDPQALAILSKPDFLTAIANLETYFSTSCAGGG